jgi:hypothetical protein
MGAIRYAVFGVAVMVAAAAALAQTTGGAGAQVEDGVAPLPTPTELFERHIEVSGGRHALFSKKTRRIKGAVTINGTPFNAFLEILAWAPNKQVIRMDQPGGVNVETGFDGTVGWRKLGDETPVRVRDEELLRLLEDADFYGEANYTKRYASYGKVTETSYLQKRVFRVPATSVNGIKRWLFFDAESGFVIGVEVPRKDAEGNESRSYVLLENYIEVGNARWPAKTTIADGDTIWILEAREIEYDPKDMPELEVPADLPPETPAAKPTENEPTEPAAEGGG